MRWSSESGSPSRSTTRRARPRRALRRRRRTSPRATGGRWSGSPPCPARRSAPRAGSARPNAATWARERPFARRSSLRCVPNPRTVGASSVCVSQPMSLPPAHSAWPFPPVDVQVDHRNRPCRPCSRFPAGTHHSPSGQPCHHSERSLLRLHVAARILARAGTWRTRLGRIGGGQAGWRRDPSGWPRTGPRRADPDRSRRDRTAPDRTAHQYAVQKVRKVFA